MKVAVFRKEHFNAAHRLHNPEWSDDKNRDVFGKCNNPSYHGHNYELIVTVKGGQPIDVAEAAPLVTALSGRGFTADIGHLTVFGRCARCEGESA